MLTRDAFLAAVAAFQEHDLDVPGLGTVHIRELSALDRIKVVQAANADGAWNGAVFNATCVQLGMTEPKLSGEDAIALVAGRDGPISLIADAIWKLSEGGPESLKSGDTQADGSEPDQDTSAGAARGKAG